MKLRLSQIAEICGGKHYGEDLSVEHIVTDSRAMGIDEKTMFVAMVGVNHDAHDYIEDVHSRGVRMFLVERQVDVLSDCGVVVVESAIAALQQLASYVRSQFRGKVVAIAGSNGKTVVKEWISQVIPHSVKLFRSPRSYNSQLGAALSLLMMDERADVALIEAGISKVGEMARLEAMIRPDIVIFTSLGDAHQENFDTFQQKIDEKLLIATNAKTIIYHSDYEEFSKSICNRFADRELFDARDCEIARQRDTASQRNAACVAAFFKVMGYGEPDLRSLQPVRMRLELKEGIANSLIIDDSYNSDINSLSIALDYARSVAGNKRLVLILSDILQSGFDEEKLYSRVAELARRAGVEQFVGVGEHLMQQRGKFNANSLFYTNTETLLLQVESLDIADAVVLIKGNRTAMVERISHRLERRSHTTVLEVNLQAMARNINYFRSYMHPQTRLIAMVKAASYGMGDVEVAQMLQKQGVAYLAVAFTDEGITLRKKGVTMPILVLNADDASFDAMVDAALEPEIYSLRSLRTFVDVACRHGVNHYPVHIKLDTGMHRLGFEEGDIEVLLATLDGCADVIKVASLFTHLATSDMTDSDEFTLQQIKTFDTLSHRIACHLPYEVMRHAAASAAIVRFPLAHYDACRLGLGLYGFGFEHNPSLEMVATLRSRIVQIRKVAATDTVGYGRAGRLSRETIIATVPIGYADGLNRHLGEGRWSLLVHGEKAPIVGRVCMDSCMIDITDIEGVCEGDEVVVFSPQEGNTPEDMARVLGTIPYEILTAVDKRVKRIYVNE